MAENEPAVLVERDERNQRAIEALTEYLPDLVAYVQEMNAALLRQKEALERIEALRTNEHAEGFDQAREIAAAALSDTAEGEKP